MGCCKGLRTLGDLEVSEGKVRVVEIRLFSHFARYGEKEARPVAWGCYFACVHRYFLLFAVPALRG